jgi:hypothetical protein
MALVGCSGTSMVSKNKQMAYADSGAVLAAAVAIDQIPADKFDATKAEIAAMCADVSKFLDDGKIADLPIEKAQQAVVEYMIKKGWTPYVSLVNVIFAWVEVQRVPVEHLGLDNILVIKQGLDGVARQATRAKKEWATPIGTANVDTTKGRALTIKK